MKKCPYCAEEIQDKAKICRYCGKKVSGFWFYRITVLILILTLIVLLTINERKVRITIARLKCRTALILKEIENVWGVLKQLTKEMHKGVSSYQQYDDNLKAAQDLQAEVDRALSTKKK